MGPRVLYTYPTCPCTYLPTPGRRSSNVPPGARSACMQTCTSTHSNHWVLSSQKCNGKGFILKAAKGEAPNRCPPVVVFWNSGPARCCTVFIQDGGVRWGRRGANWVLLEYYVIDTPTPRRYDRQGGKKQAFLAIKATVKPTTTTKILLCYFRTLSSIPF